MSEIFISHAATDNAEALEVLSWLHESGRHNVFMDSNTDRGLKAGEQWQSKLLEAISQCEAFLCLLSDHWIESKWCWAEYILAKKLGKRCIPLIVRQIERGDIPGEILAEHQLVDLVSDVQCWIRLESGLRAAEIEAVSFSLQQGRPPFPGLAPLTEEDAALFFGRDAELLVALDELRRLSEFPDSHLFAIIAPSGAGKSSFLRAGLMPRLLRDNRNFLPLPTLRPFGGILSGPAGFWTSLQNALVRSDVAERPCATIPRSRGAIRTELEANPESLFALLKALLDIAGQEAGLSQGLQQTLVLPIDQGEELFNPQYREETKQFLTLILSSFMESIKLIMIVAARTDAYGLFQSDPLFEAFRHRPFNLSPLPAHRFASVIEGPAAKVELSIEPALTDALVHEASGADALPMVAFTLERLYREFGAEGRLTLQNYRATGGVAGAIEVAFQHALSIAPAGALPANQDLLLDRVRQLFIPHLVRVDETGAFARRIARIDELPEETRPIAELLIENRLLVVNKDPQGTGAFVEIAHEALIRSWEQLAIWLKEERAFLVWREDVSRARLLSIKSQRDLLSGRELMIASQWKARRGNAIAQPDLEYINASEKRAEVAAVRAQRTRSLVTKGAVAAALVLAVLAGISMWQATVATSAKVAADNQTAIARQQTKAAQARELSLQANSLLENSADETSLATLLAAESLDLSPTLEGQRLASRILELTRNTREFPTREGWSDLLASPDGRMLLNWTHDGKSSDAPASGSVVTVDSSTLSPSSIYSFAGRVSPALSSGARWLAISGYARQLQVIELASNKRVLNQDYTTLITAQFDHTGQWLYVADTQGVIEQRMAPDWHINKQLHYSVVAPGPWRFGLSVHPSGDELLVHSNQGLFIVPTDGTPHKTVPLDGRWVKSAFYDSGGSQMLTMEGDDAVRLRDARSATVYAELQHDHELSSAAFSNDGMYVATATEVGDVRIWNAQDGELIHELRHEKYVNDVKFSPDAGTLAVGDDAGVIALWDTLTGQLKHRWIENDEIWTIAFAENGSALVAGSGDGYLRRYDLASNAPTSANRLSGGVHKLVVDPLSGVMVAGITGTQHASSWLDMSAIDRATENQQWSLSQNGDFRLVVFSPDSKRIATSAGGTGELKIWDTATGTLQSTSTAKAYGNSPYFSADGTRLIATDGSASIVDSNDGSVVASIGEPGGVTHVGIADDHRTVITYGDDATFRSWDALTGEQNWQRSLSENDGWITLSGDGSRYAQSSRDKLYVKDTQSGAEVSVIPTERSSLVLSRDGSRALLKDIGTLRDPVSGARFSRVQLWDIDSVTLLAEVRGDDNDIFIDTAFTPDNLVMIRSPNHPNRWLEVLDADTGELLWRRDLTPTKGWPFTGNQFPTLGRDGERLLLPDANSTWVLNQRTGETDRLFDIPLTIQAQTRDGNILAAVVAHKTQYTETQEVLLLDMDSGKRLGSIDVSAFTAVISDIKLSPDDSKLLVEINRRGGGSLIKMFDMATGGEIGTIDPASDFLQIEFLAEEDLLLSRDRGGTIRVWRPSTGEELHRFSHDFTVTGIDVAARANQAVTWTGASLRVWELANGKELAHAIVQRELKAVAIHPDGGQIAYVQESIRTNSGDEFDEVFLWSPGMDITQSMSLQIEQSAGRIAFDPSGRLLAAQIGKRRVRVWNLQSMRPLFTAVAMAISEINDFEFSDDGNRLLIREITSRSYGPGVRHQSGIRVWHIASGKEILRSEIAYDWLQDPNSSALFLRQKSGWRELELDVEHKPWPELNSHIYPVAGDAYVAGKNSTEIKLISLNTDKVIEIPVDENAHEIGAFAFSAEGDQVVFAQLNAVSVNLQPGVIVLRDLPSGAELARAAPDTRISKLSFVDGGQSIVMLSPLNMWTYVDANQLLLWHWQTGELSVLSADNPIQALAVSPDGSLLATAEGSWEGLPSERQDIVGVPRVRIWDTRTGLVSHTVPSERPLSDVQFSPDGRFMLGRNAHEFYVYRVEDWENVDSFSIDLGEEAGKTAFAGNDWAIAPAEFGLYLFSITSDRQHFLRHESAFPKFRVSTDGRTIATADRTTLTVWDVDTGQALFRRSIEGDIDFTLTGSDADLWLTGDQLLPDDALMRIPWKSSELLNALCARAGRGFTDEEIARYFEADLERDSECTDNGDVPGHLTTTTPVENSK